MANNRTLLPGIAVSLLLHAGLIAMLAAPNPPEPRPDARRMLVWLTPKAAPPAVAVAATPRRPPVAPATPSRARQPASANPAAATAQRPPMAVVPAAPPVVAPASAQASAQADAVAGAGLPADPFAPPAAPVQGKFDVNAAMKSARTLATAKSTKDDPPVAQIYDKPLYGLPSDTPLGSAVSRTARPDCKNIASGTGLLALVIVPVMILTDKKDSGCKW